MYLDKENKKIIEKNMSKSIRKIYKEGGTIKVKIERFKPLKKWGEYIILKITKNGKILYNDLYEDFTSYEIYNENSIISYFIYGDYKYDYLINYEVA